MNVSIPSVPLARSSTIDLFPKQQNPGPPLEANLDILGDPWRGSVDRGSTDQAVSSSKLDEKNHSNVKVKATDFGVSSNPEMVMAKRPGTSALCQMPLRHTETIGGLNYQ